MIMGLGNTALTELPPHGPPLDLPPQNQPFSRVVSHLVSSCSGVAVVLTLNALQCPERQVTESIRTIFCSPL